MNTDMTTWVHHRKGILNTFWTSRLEPIVAEQLTLFVFLLPCRHESVRQSVNVTAAAMKVTSYGYRFPQLKIQLTQNPQGVRWVLRGVPMANVFRDQGFDVLRRFEDHEHISGAAFSNQSAALL